MRRKLKVEGSKFKVKPATCNLKPATLNQSMELKAAATTTVGNMKGTAVRARSRDLPRKSKREKRMADGIPRMKVKIVERSA